MEPKLFATVFGTVFLVELGNKTQLATLFYASNAANPNLTVFSASAAALVLVSALGVLAGTLVSDCVNPNAMRRFAGLGFAASGIRFEPKSLATPPTLPRSTGLCSKATDARISSLI